MKKEKLYAPLMLSTLNEITRPMYLKLLKDAEVDFLFIALDRKFGEENIKQFENLKECINYFEKEGFSCGVWFQAIGLPYLLDNESHELSKHFTKVVGLMQENVPEKINSFCILDENLVEYVKEIIKLSIESGAKMLMIDDDMCLSLREAGCACEKHLKLFYENLGYEISRKEIYDNLTKGKPNKVRSIWMKTIGDTFRDFCRKLRDYTDTINPDIRFGYCSGYTSWDEEGADAIELTKILAGNTRPFLRLTGAPYWVVWQDRFHGQNFQSVIEYVREQVSWCKENGSDIELFDENDSYPRPRSIVPASYMEIYDQCLRFSTDTGSFKYMYDYVSSPEYELGYIKAHNKNRKMREFILNNKGNKDEGIIIFDKQRKLEYINLPENGGYSKFTTEVFKNAQRFITKQSLPVKYEGFDNTVAVFGECARFIEPEKYNKGIILDLPAAVILQERGYDLGLKAYEKAAPVMEHFAENEKTALSLDMGITYKLEVNEKAEVLSKFEFDGGVYSPSSYIYKNEKGEKYLIYAFDGNYVPKLLSQLYSSYYRRKYLIEAILNMGGSIPMSINNCSDLYVLANKDENSISLFLSNMGADIIYTPEITLYDKFSKAEVMGGEATLKDNKLIFSSDIYAFTTVCIKLYK